MTKRMMGLAVLALAAAGVLLFAQAKPSEAQSDGVKVYTQQGYYIKAKNSNNYAVKYSFSYTQTGYNDKGEVVSKEEMQDRNRTLLAGEERQLFTAPTNPQKRISYLITIDRVFDVTPIKEANRQK